MQDTRSENKNESVPVPPPPPLPSAKKTKAVTSKELGTSSPVDSNPDYFPSVPRHIEYLFDRSSQNIISYYEPILSVLQEGPSCGIVALSMASQYFRTDCLSPQQILETAQKLNFTRNGEMFSVYNMSKLASSLLKCKAIVLSDISNHKVDILKSICCNRPILIPYDADKNHEPCLNHGKNAHWAILCGVCFSVNDNIDLGDLVLNEKVCKVVKGTEAEKFLSSSVKVCVYAHQGKSRHSHIWDFESLLLSNKNLLKVTNKYSSEEMVLPIGSDTLHELRDKAIILH